MNKKLSDFLSKYVALSDEMRAVIDESVAVREYAKGTVLLRGGEISGECYFVLAGIVREYYLREGDELTTEFYAEGDVVTPVTYGKPDPSPYWIECAEPVVAAIGTPDAEIGAFARDPRLQKLNGAIAEALMARYRQTHNDYKINTPEGRYAHLLENRPDLMDRVPHYQIASYLGITPESLSRIRKRRMQNSAK